MAEAEERINPLTTLHQPRPMQLDRDGLVDTAPRVIRRVGDDLLSKVRKTHEALQDGDNSDALHDHRVALRRLRSWIRDFDDDLRDTLRPKQIRRLKRLAEATRDSRDLQVHIALVEKFARSNRTKNRAGIEWLLQELRTRKARAGLALRRTLDRDFDRTVTAVAKAFRCYTAKVDERPRPFARVASELVRSRCAAARDALGRVKSIGDRAEGHAARIEAKRLRYLLEPLHDSIEGVEKVVKQLSEVQDVLGALHDAQLFGSEVASHLARVLASASANSPADQGDIDADHDRAEGLLAISRRLRRDEQSAFSRVESDWLGDSALPLWSDIERIAVRLEEIARAGREVERKYLLTALPADVRPVEVIEVDQGYLPGERLVERVRRVRTADRAEYYRTVKVGQGLDRMELEEQTTARVFDALWPLTKGHRVQKRRHRIEDDGRQWEIDEFLDRSLIVAEVEVEDPGDTVAIPEWLEPIVDRDVTDDDDYSNQNLAR